MADGNTSYEAQLELALPFLRGFYETIDPSLPSFMRVLREKGASECWHKHGTFYEHLVDVYRILKLWKAPDAVARCGLFHSAYSNSYVNLVIFEPDVGREQVRDIIGPEAEELVHLFCIVPRQQLIHDMLLFQFTDEECTLALSASGHAENVRNRSLHHLMDKLSTSIENEVNKVRAFECKQKLRKVLPPEGITVKHIRTGEDFIVPRRIIAVFLLLTMADFIDQLYGWQDVLFGNRDGTMKFQGNNWMALWPGDSKPGLWMSSISRMGLLLNLIVREEREMDEKRKMHGEVDKFSALELKIPPVFDNCTSILSPANMTESRDLYWEAICMEQKENILELVEPLLQKACKLNPWVGEPHIVLAQVYLSQEKFDVAEKEAKEGLRILLEWGTNWDKRMSWEGWIAWSRVLVSKAQEKTWPKTSWGILNLGLVK